MQQNPGETLAKCALQSATHRSQKAIARDTMRVQSHGL